MPIDRNTEDARDLFDRGHAAHDSGELAEAIECFSRAIRLRPDVAAAYRSRAAVYAQMGDRGRALADLEHAIHLKPADTQSYAERATVFFAQKAYDRAIADCDRVLADDLGRADVRVIRGNCHAARGDTEAALQDYSDAIATDPQNAANVLLLRARLHLECGQASAALTDCDAALLENPENAEAHHTRALALHAMEDFPGAVSAFTAVVERTPGHALAWLGRAACFSRLGQPDQVVADATAALELAPNLGSAFELRGVARQTRGELDDAIEDLNTAVRLSPTVGPLYLRAGVYLARGEQAAAVRDYLAVLQRDPRHAATFNQLAWLWATDAAHRDGERAKEFAVRACELADWQNAAYLDTLAAAHAACGEYAEAAAWEQKAIDLADDPSYSARLQVYRNAPSV